MLITAKQSNPVDQLDFDFLEAALFAHYHLEAEISQPVFVVALLDVKIVVHVRPAADHFTAVAAFDAHPDRAALERLLDPENQSVTLQTLDKAAQALGKRVQIALV